MTDSRERLTALETLVRGDGWGLVVGAAERERARLLAELVHEDTSPDARVSRAAEVRALDFVLAWPDKEAARLRKTLTGGGEQ